MGKKDYKNLSRLDKFFGITKNKSSLKTEIYAGFATFLAMAYILTVNPNNILFGGTSDPRWPSVFIATSLGAFVGTLFMAFLAKMPLAQASGMGLNAIIGGMIGGTMGFAFNYGNAMLLVFLSGIIFLLLSVVPIGKDEDGKRVTCREKIFDGMPEAVRTAIPVGIGLFIAFIGMQNANIIQTNEYTLVQFVDLTNKANWALGGVGCQAIVALFGLLVITVLSHYRVKGSVIMGILSATLLAIPLKVANIDILLGKVDGVSWAFYDNFKNYFSMNPEEGGIFLSMFTEGFNLPEGSLMICLMTILTFIMIDMFDTMGTIVGCCANANLLDKKGKPQNFNKIMNSDSLATCTGALLGTSTVTTFVESGAGVAEGGRTGLTALVAAILFFLSIFILPIFAFIPEAAAGSALIYVGVLMMSNVKNIDFSEVKESVPAFLTISMMVLSYSITNGIGLGVISYFFINVLIYIIDVIKFLRSDYREKPRLEISLVTFIVTILFLIYFLVPTI